jgi:LPXTG-site transpeptidase (sortase) family protein
MSANFTKVFSWKKAALILFCVGVVTASLSVFIQSQSQVAQGFRSEDSKLVASSASIVPARLVDSALQNVESLPHMVAVNSGSSFEAPGKPVRLLIPSIGVDAAIQSVGLSWKGNGEMGIPTNFTDVAWYNEGPLPGMPGSAVIDGHLDGKKVQEAVFYNLDNLKPGDLVEVIDQNGKTLQFSVVDTKIYDYNAPTNDIFYSDALKARLNLITCAGDWIKSQKLYNKRIVVFTELINN